MSAGDDDVTADDDTTSTDACDDHAGELLCDGQLAVGCDGSGDVEWTEDCDLDEALHCHPGYGCIACFPDERWCSGAEVLECADDGRSWTTAETCEGATGEVCHEGECYTPCEFAALTLSNEGCLFLTIDMEQAWDSHCANLPYAVALSNVDSASVAHARIEVLTGSSWEVLVSEEIDPLDSVAFELPNAQLSGTGLDSGRAYRILTDLPVAAYQFNPLDQNPGQWGPSHTSDASLLLPVTTYGSRYRIPSWGSEWGHSLINVVAVTPGTSVTVTPTMDTAAGMGIPAGQAGVPLAPVVMGEGDLLLSVGAAESSSLDGSLVEADAPVAVFAGHSCANIPPDLGACDHLEEQILSQQQWGRSVVAARLTPRDHPPEEVVWHLIAGDLATTLTFEAPASVVGLPPGNTLVLGAGESAELWVTGTHVEPGDFTVSGSEPFLAVQYAKGGEEIGIGDPCMVQAVPVEQYLDRYVVLVPPDWEEDSLTLIREMGETLAVDGIAVESWPLGFEVSAVDGVREVVRIPVEDGVYALEGSAPFGVQVVGYDEWDSYCYPGGLSLKPISDRAGGVGGDR